MSTPVLTQEQQRKTLSAKKGPVKGLRNVLAQPYDIYWPVLKNVEGGELEKQLRDLMLHLKRPKASIPWSQLRKMKKKDRILVKKTSHENDKISSLNKSVVTGVNEVTRGLERNDLCFVLLDANVELIVVKHIVTMTENENIPAVLIPFLKIVTLETLGFESAAFALKNDVKNSTDHHFHALYNKISELSASFIRPNLLDQSFPNKVLKDDETIESNPVTILNHKNFKIQTVPTFTLSSNFYLYRSSTRGRIFVPRGPNSTIISLRFSKDGNDFIPFVGDPSPKPSSDMILGKKIEKIHAKTERYMDFCNQIGALNEKISVTNDNGEIFAFLDTSFSKRITKNRIDVLLEKAESSNNEKDITRCATTTFSYIPLKVKRMQGNSSRIKATKAQKSKKK